jgi:hypothetical protein
VRCYPFALALLVVTVGTVVYVRSLPNWHTHVETLFGTYSGVLIRHTVPANLVESLLVELIALALGVGLLPAIVSIPWYFKRLSRPRADRRWVFLLSAGVVMLLFLVGTAVSQNGYLGPLTEERYFFYVAPVFWLGAFAALEDRDLSRGQIVASALGLSALFAAIPFLSPLSSETAFLAPVESVVRHVVEQRFKQFGIGGTVQDGLALLALLAGIATAIIWHRWRRARLWWVAGVAAAVQLLITGYAFAVIDGKVQGIAGRTGGSLGALGWLNSRAAGAQATWLENGAVEPAAPGAYPAAVNRMRSTLFWNSNLRSWAALGQLALPVPEWPMTALPGFYPLAIDTTTGYLAPVALTSQIHTAVEATDSPFVQLSGSRLGSSPEGALSLTAPSHPVRAQWLALGLQPNGYFVSGPPAHIFAFAQRSPAPQAVAVTLTIAPPPAPTPATATPATATPAATTPATAAPASSARSVTLVRLGRTTERLTLSAGSGPRVVRLVGCFAPWQSALAGSLRVVHPVSVAGIGLGGTLTAVSLAPAGSSRRCP